MALSHHHLQSHIKWFLLIVVIIVTLVFVRLFEGQAGKLSDVASNSSQRNLELKVRNIRIQADLARTPSEQEQGLSGRETLPEFAGLLFLFRQDGTPGFWMKEMNFSLDIIWIDNNLRIVAIDRNVTPDSFPKIFYPPQPIRYVLEVNAGLTDSYNINPGDEVTI